MSNFVLITKHTSTKGQDCRMVLREEALSFLNNPERVIFNPYKLEITFPTIDNYRISRKVTKGKSNIYISLSKYTCREILEEGKYELTKVSEDLFKLNRL